MRDKILALLTRHQQTLRRETAEIAGRIARVADLSADDRETLVRQVHTLKGSSGSLGFHHVFQAAERLEHAMRALRGSEDWGGAQTELQALFGTLHGLVAELRIEDSALYTKFA